MATEIQAPNSLEEVKKNKKLSIFLAGSIGSKKGPNTASMWQKEIIDNLKEHDIYFLNPRRNDWDSSWIESIDNRQFNEQVTWELNALDIANLIIFYFDPSSVAPISLLELGLHAKDNKVVVCCPEGYEKRGNVQIVCERYGIPQAKSLKDLINKLKIVLSDK